MASTFTLKRKTYTEFDYHNDIATKGFSDGISCAVQRMYASRFNAAMEGFLSKHPKAGEYVFNSGIRDAVAKAAKKGEEFMPKNEGLRSLYNEGVSYLNKKDPEMVRKHFQQFPKGYGAPVNGQQVRSEFSPRGGNNPSAPQLQQRAASFIGKGYLY